MNPCSGDSSGKDRWICLNCLFGICITCLWVIAEHTFMYLLSSSHDDNHIMCVKRIAGVAYSVTVWGYMLTHYTACVYGITVSIISLKIMSCLSKSYFSTRIDTFNSINCKAKKENWYEKKIPINDTKDVSK